MIGPSMPRKTLLNLNSKLLLQQGLSVAGRYSASFDRRSEDIRVQDVSHSSSTFTISDISQSLYGVEFSDVQTETKPSDCDFLQAPLGLKECSYKAHVQVYNADGLYVGSEKAPLYRSDTTTGKSIVSFDNGKTWEWWDGTTLPNLKPKSVKVHWVKE
jgi:hypothetical protein